MVFLRLGAGCAVLLCLGAGCASTAPARRPLAIRPPEPPAAAYEVASSAGAVWAEGPAVSRFERAIRKGAQVSGQRLTGDGRLATLASWLGAHMRGDGALPSPEISDFYARHLGLVDVMPRVVVLPHGRPSDVADQLAQAVILRLAEQPYTHYGVASVSFPAGSGRAASDADSEAAAGQKQLVLERRWLLVLSYRPLSLGRVSRAMPVGAAIHVRGRLPTQYRNPQVEVFAPGRVRELVPAGVGPDFDVRIPTGGSGAYQVEVLAEGQRGMRSLARMSVYIGTQAPREKAFPPRDDLDRTRAAQARLLASLQAERRRARLPALAVDPVLSMVAARHSLDMRDGAFVGHESPRTGGPRDRVERAGFGRATVLENIARASAPEGLFKAMMARPGQRANVLSDEPTHIGVAVVPEPWAGGTRFVATALLVPVQPDIDVGGASAAVLSALNQVREAGGLGPVVLDPDLETAALQAVSGFFELPLVDEKATVDETNRALTELGLHFRRTGAVVALVQALDQVRALEALSDPALTHVGIGVAQGDRPDRTPNAVAVVVALGWQR